jgi:hypothetical protein
MHHLVVSDSGYLFFITGEPRPFIEDGAGLPELRRAEGPLLRAST